MKKLITTLGLAACSSIGFAQTLQWKQSYGSTGGEIGYSTHVDAAGNNYSGGTFTNTITAGSDGESNLTITATGTNSNGYLIKKQPTGILLWSAAFVGAGNCVVHGIATDASNNVFITGYFTGTIDFNPSPSVNNSLTAAGTTGTNDFFVCKLTSAGAYAWAYRFGEINNDYAFDIATDAAGNVHIAGLFNTQNSGSGVVDFDPSTSASTMSSTLEDGFLLKLSNNGTYLAKQKMGTTNSDAIRSITIGRNNKLYLTGYYSSSGISGQTTGLISSGGGLQYIVAKLDANNYSLVWQRGYGSDYEDTGYGITTDGYGAIFIGGMFKGTISFSTGFSLTNPSNVLYDGFIMRMDTSANIAWVKQIEGSGASIITKTKMDNYNNLLITGYFDGSVDLNPSTTVASNFTSAGGNDAFVIKMNESGNLVGTPVVFGSTADEKAYSVATSGNDFYVTGNFSGTIDVDITSTVSNLVSAGGTDAFWVKYTESTCNTPTIVSTSIVPACGTGNATLSAQANFGTLNWYLNASGGSVRATGNTYTFAPQVTTTTYVSATIGTCTSARVAVQAIVNPRPTITFTANSFDACAGNSVTLGTTFVNNTSGIVVWYDSPTSTTPLDTGLTFTTPVLNASKVYYAEGNLDGCLSNSRLSLSANITPIPTVTSVQNGGRCSTSSDPISLGATTSGGNIDWYAASSGGAKLRTGTGIAVTPTTTTTYYAQANHSGCLSARVPVVAYVSAVPVLTVPVIGDSVCVGEQATLNASTSAGIVIWYNSSITALDTGNVFLTPSLSATTTYLVRAYNNFCYVDKYTIAFTKPLPSVAVTTSGATLTATETGATYQWATCGSKNTYNPILIGISNAQSYTGGNGGVYAVFVTKNGCKDTSSCITLTVTGVEEETTMQNVAKIFPNPNNGEFSIELTMDAEVDIIDQTGRIVKTIQVEKGRPYTVDDLPKGLFILKSQASNKAILGKVLVSKF
jgi:hypothetical protein